MSISKDYYEGQLKKVSSENPEYPRAFKITDNGTNTNWLNLNDESATELVKYLKKYYNIDESVVNEK